MFLTLAILLAFIGTDVADAEEMLGIKSLARALLVWKLLCPLLLTLAADVAGGAVD